jgi:Ala-tRNA(Pro) deacylase
MSGHATSDHLLQQLAALGVAHETHAHPPVFTVAEGADIKTRLPGTHSKNLFLKDKKGRLFLLCARDETVIDLAALAKMLAAGRLSFGAPELLKETMGVTPGSVTLFALINDRLQQITLLLDEALMGGARVNFHPLRNDATTALSPHGVRVFLEFTGHAPIRLAFDADGVPRLIDAPDAWRHLGG